MSEGNKNHETQQETDYKEIEILNTPSMMEEAQRIEGGGSPKRIDFNDLPKPIRVFGYFFIGALILMAVIVFISAWMK